MRTRALRTFAVAACLLSLSAVLTAESDFSELDIQQLLAASKEYRHRSDVLRKMIGARERKIGAIQQQANALVLQAEQEAQARLAQANAANNSNQLAGSLLGGLSGLIPAGDMMNDLTRNTLSTAGKAVAAQGHQQVADAAAQASAQLSDARGDADSLMSQIGTFDAEKKKLAYKARQYEQLADAKDLLAASEILRLESEKQSRAIAEADKSIEADRQFVRSMSLW